MAALHRGRGAFWSLSKHEIGNLARCRRCGQIAAQFAEDRLGFGAVRRHRIGTQRHCDHRELAIVFVLFGARHVGPHMAQIGGEEAGRFGHMHPCQHARVAGGIGRSIGQCPADRSVDAVYAVDRRLRIVPVAEGRYRDEPCSPAQPSVHVAAEVRMVEHALQRMRMQHLQQQTADPADHHRHDIRMHHPDRRILREQGLVGHGHRGFASIHVVEHAAHLLDELETQAFGQRDGRHGDNM